MAAEETDQPGVLGNLPRSRPGQRSEKRGGATRAASAAGTNATSRSPAAARKPKAAAPKRKPASGARKPAAAASTPRRERPAPAAAESPSRPPDPITAAFRVAGKITEVGLKTAGGILRRLPGR